MRIESSVTAVSRIPSEMVHGLAELPFSLGVDHYDDPLPDRLDGLSIPDTLEQLRVATVAVDGRKLVELGPGAVVEERAVLESVAGRRGWPRTGRSRRSTVAGSAWQRSKSSPPRAPT